MATETVTSTQAGEAATTLGDTVKRAVKDMAQAAG
jgi:hypothetical protein